MRVLLDANSSTNAASGCPSQSVVFGDFASFGIRDVRPLRVGDRTPRPSAPTRQTLSTALDPAIPGKNLSYPPVRY